MTYTQKIHRRVGKYDVAQMKINHKDTTANKIAVTILEQYWHQVIVKHGLNFTGLDQIRIRNETDYSS